MEILPPGYFYTYRYNKKRTTHSIELTKPPITLYTYTLRSIYKRTKRTDKAINKSTKAIKSHRKTLNKSSKPKKA